MLEPAGAAGSSHAVPRMLLGREPPPSLTSSTVQADVT
jgi:hypothetical protein